MNRSFFVAAASVATLSLAGASTASAQGTFANVLNVVGQAQISSTGAGNGFPLFIDFLSGSQYPPTMKGNGSPGNVFAGTNTGVFTSVAGGANGTIQDLQVSAGGASTTTNPTNMSSQFLTIGGTGGTGGYTFSLGSAPAGSTFGPITLRDTPGGSEADFSVYGTVTGSGFDPGTQYEGLFTAQFVGESAAQVYNDINSPNGTKVVTFSANFGAPLASTVPEPSSYALIAAGLGMLGAVARRRRLA